MSNINQFKDIIGNKGFAITSKDRKIFERDFSKSLFGLDGTQWFRHGKTDVIEFILYDSNNNQLPQGDTNMLVRYIYLDDANISKYFLINNNPDTTKTNEARQYMVDTEKLINEAGYTNGIFKTQITLLNRRVGSENRKFDKLWIHEISPSRTEIRVLPVKNGDDEVLTDLAERYKVYTDNGEFRDDTISFVKQFIDNVDIHRVVENFLKIKGITVEGKEYIKLLKDEFKIPNFDAFLEQIKTKYVEAMNYFVENKVYDINSLIYGNSISTEPSVELSIDTIKTTAVTTLQTIIDFYLYQRTIIKDSVLSKEDQITFDPISKILKTTTEDSNYETTIPESVAAVISGCTDPHALNYNALAIKDDGSCTYLNEDNGSDIEVITNTDVRGCTNPAATNYNPLATIDDGSCVISDNSQNKTSTFKTFYVWSTTGVIQYTNKTGLHNWHGNEYQSTTISYNPSKYFKITGDVREYAKIQVDLPICSDRNALNYGKAGKCIYNPVPLIDPTVTTYSEGELLHGGSSPIVTISGNNLNI